MIRVEDVSEKKVLFTESKSDQYFLRSEPKSALNPENGWLRFLSSQRKLLPTVTSVSVITIVNGGDHLVK